MRITIIAIGSRGDVQPYVALAGGLRAAGHRVRVATHATFETFVRERELDFAPVEGDPRTILASEAGRAWLEKSRNVLLFGRGLARVATPLLSRCMADCWRACRDADVIVASMLGVLVGFHIAEKEGLPLVRAFYSPITPTRANPADFVPAWLPLGGGANLATHRLSRQLLWQFFRSEINAVRDEVLGLPPLPAAEPFEAMDRRHWPLLYGYSPAVFPTPPDWGDWIHVTGYWFLDRLDTWQPPADLVAFLKAGPPPVYIGFGSMNTGDPAATTDLVLQALRRVKQRGVLLTGWGGLSGAARPEEAFTIDAVPHDWLFPRMAAVVHHGGPGTTAAGLRAGVPTVVTPVFGDQPFWGRRVHALGVGPRPVPLRHLTVERLAAAIQRATGDRVMRARAAALGERIRAEDGIGRAVEIFHRYVPAVR